MGSVSNNTFVDRHAFDGIQKHLLRDFTRIHHINLHGDVNRDRMLSGTSLAKWVLKRLGIDNAGLHTQRHTEASWLLPTNTAPAIKRQTPH